MGCSFYRITVFTNLLGDTNVVDLMCHFNISPWFGTLHYSFQRQSPSTHPEFCGQYTYRKLQFTTLLFVSCEPALDVHSCSLSGKVMNRHAVKLNRAHSHVLFGVHQRPSVLLIK